MEKTNTLIVGQGIAGTMVAYALHLQQIPFLVIDPVLPNTSSRIAAGMFTPISGKRKTITPMVPEQIAHAIETYRAIEQLIGIRFLNLLNVYQVYNSQSEKNELVAKLDHPDFAKFVISSPGTLPNIKLEVGAFGITNSGWLDCALLIEGFGQWLKQNDSLLEAEFLYKDLKVGNTAMEYHGISFLNIVFCEGYRAVNNPYFNNENVIPCKGDLLTIKYENLDTGNIIKKNGIYLLPAGNNLWRVGATHRWNDKDDRPDEVGKKFLEGGLDALLESRYETIDHKAAIRPTTYNREVIAKQHSKYTGMFMLNGFGSKGVLLGPWWARYIAKLCVR